MPRSTANELLQRFQQERENIWRYVLFLEYVTQVKPSKVRDIVYVLSSYGLAPESGPLSGTTLRVFDTTSSSPDADELREMQGQIEALRPLVMQTLKQAGESLRLATAPVDLSHVDVRSDLGGAIQFMIDVLDAGEPTQEHLHEARSELANQITELGTSYLLGPRGEHFTHDETVEYAVQAAFFLQEVSRQRDLAALHDDIAELDLAIRMSLPESEINSLRQGFITLMTIFDATIFDIVRIAFENDFFRLLTGFTAYSAGEKLSLKQVIELGSFDRLREKLVEDQLRGKYLRDLLHILKHLNVPGIEDPGTNSFAEAIEMVNRRNIHIHNRGTVDEKYLDLDEQGNARFNIFHLTMGDYATIDEAYWQHVHELCDTIASNVATWADALAVIQPDA